MTTATKITLFRVVMIPVFLVCMYLSEIWSWMQIVSCVVFAVASLSDILDGQIARRCNQVTDLGKFLDPLADKVLVIAAMAMFCEWGIYPAWALMIVLAREFAVTGLRLIAAGKGQDCRHHDRPELHARLRPPLCVQRGARLGRRGRYHRHDALFRHRILRPESRRVREYEITVSDGKAPGAVSNRAGSFLHHPQTSKAPVRCTGAHVVPNRISRDS